MPKISAFYGIIIYMYFNDHAPPHFHAKYNQFEALIEISGLSIIAGDLPSRALGIVIEWASLHREELAANWARAQNHEPLTQILPL
ncbi:MAG: DUF4160 domain-containing protein [Saprospirales bacterium]|nr:DUF4160 domain-containing protein [Saprospirales bacterium]